MPAEYAIRQACPGDLDGLLLLFLALQDHVEGSNPDLWRMTAEARDQLRSQLLARLTARGSCVLVAVCRQATVVGMVFGRIVTNQRYVPSRTGSVEQLFVHPDHRRARIGTHLMAHLCQFFVSQGVDDLSLRYAAGNKEASAFWTALGFAPRIVTAGVSRRTLEARLSRLRDG